MKSYQFSMERVLELRSNHEKTWMEKFATLQNEFIHQKTILNEFQTELINYKMKLSKCKKIQDLRQLYLCKEVLEMKIQEQEKHVEEASKNLEKGRINLVNAQKDRKIMEKLKEKDYESYQENIKSIEQKDLDEMAVLKYKVKS